MRGVAAKCGAAAESRSHQQRGVQRARRARTARRPLPQPRPARTLTRGRRSEWHAVLLVAALEEAEAAGGKELAGRGVQGHRTQG